jgi:hypothetical protein
MDRTKAVGVKKKPAAAQVMTRVQVKKKPAAGQFISRVVAQKMLDEVEEKCMSDLQDLKRDRIGTMVQHQVKMLLDERDDNCRSAIQDLKRELMGTMVQHHDQTHSKLKRLHEGAIDTYNAMNNGMTDLSDSICNVEEELKRQRGPITPPKSPTEVEEESTVVEEESPYKGFSYKDAKITFYG